MATALETEHTQEVTRSPRTLEESMQRQLDRAEHFVNRLRLETMQKDPRIKTSRTAKARYDEARHTLEDSIKDANVAIKTGYSQTLLRTELKLIIAKTTGFKEAAKQVCAYMPRCRKELPNREELEALGHQILDLLNRSIIQEYELKEVITNHQKILTEFIIILLVALNVHY